MVDDDSWGEASEDSDVEDFVPRQKGQGSKQPAFPLPPMSFALVPVQYPGSVGYKQTPPKNAKRKDYLRRKTKPGFYQNKVKSNAKLNQFVYNIAMTFECQYAMMQCTWMNMNKYVNPSCIQQFQKHSLS